MGEPQRRLCGVKATPSAGSQATTLLEISPSEGYSLAPADRCLYEPKKETK